MNMFLVIENFYHLDSRVQIGLGKALEKDFRIENGKVTRVIEEAQHLCTFPHIFFYHWPFLYYTDELSV